MRKHTFAMTSHSRRAYLRPLITAVVPVSSELLAATPTPDVDVDPNPGDEALSKEGNSDLWEVDKEDEEETPRKPFTYD